MGNTFSNLSPELSRKQVMPWVAVKIQTTNTQQFLGSMRFDPCKHSRHRRWLLGKEGDQRRTRNIERKNVNRPSLRFRQPSPNSPSVPSTIPSFKLQARLSNPSATP